MCVWACASKRLRLFRLVRACVCVHVCVSGVFHLRTNCFEARRVWLWARQWLGGTADGNRGREKLQRWLAAELLSLPFPQDPIDMVSLVDAVGTVRTRRDLLQHLPITVADPIHNPLTDHAGATSVSGEVFDAYLDGDIPYNLDLPRQWDPPRSSGTPHLVI